MDTPPEARDLDLCLCHSCGLACDMTNEPETCPRCDAPLHLSLIHISEPTRPY